MFALSEAHLLQHLSGQPAAPAQQQQVQLRQVARRSQAEIHIRGIEQRDAARLQAQLRARGANRRNAERRNGYLEQSNLLAAEILARLHPEAAAAKAQAPNSMKDDFDDVDDDDLFDDLDDL